MDHLTNSSFLQKDSSTVILEQRSLLFSSPQLGTIRDKCKCQVARYKPLSSHFHMDDWMTGISRYKHKMKTYHSHNKPLSCLPDNLLSAEMTQQHLKITGKMLSAMRSWSMHCCNSQCSTISSVTQCHGQCTKRSRSSHRGRGLHQGCEAETGGGAVRTFYSDPKPV